MASTTPFALRQHIAALRAFLVLTVVLGLVYPLTMTGVAQVLFPDRADGSLVATSDGAVGSELIGQSFTRPVMEGGDPVRDSGGALVMAPDPAYFQSRPSAAGDGYDPLSSSASNYGPENEELIALVEERRAAVAELDAVEGGEVSPHALLASGSGLDPHISPAYAAQQVDRVADVRRMDPSQVRKLVAEHTEGRALGILGEPTVNVLLLNLALDDVSGPIEAADLE
jgi:K+-transporting ATPase ATPase C chain